MYNSLRQSQLLDVSGITEISIITLITSDNVNGWLCDCPDHDVSETCRI